MSSPTFAADAPAVSFGSPLGYTVDAEDLIPSVTIHSSAVRKERLEPKQKRWGIILAGGDGIRLRGLTRIISGDDRPKQFCRVLGGYTLLEQTQIRAARSIAPDKTIVALTHAHAPYFLQDLSQSTSRMLIQPSNKGTAPPILLGLLNIARQERDAIVAVLPSDHYYSDESAFTESLEAAFQIAQRNPESVVLLGARPNGPEIEFGWIEVGSAIGAIHEDLFAVKGFKEKPPLNVAEQLLKNGALWNTFVMVGNVQAYIDIAWKGTPALMERLGLFLMLAPESRDISIPATLYDGISPTDFSRHVLTPGCDHLMAIKLSCTGWNDLGQPDRVMSVLHSRSGMFPSWIHLWESPQELSP